MEVSRRNFIRLGLLGGGGLAFAGPTAAINVAEKTVSSMPLANPITQVELARRLARARFEAVMQAAPEGYKFSTLKSLVLDSRHAANHCLGFIGSEAVTTNGQLEFVQRSWENVDGEMLRFRAGKLVRAEKSEIARKAISKRNLERLRKEQADLMRFIKNREIIASVYSTSMGDSEILPHTRLGEVPLGAYYLPEPLKSLTMEEVRPLIFEQGLVEDYNPSFN